MNNTKSTTIKSAVFIKGIVDVCDELESDIPQIALIGRSNSGKSSIINSLTNQRDLARVSSLPGRTREINLFLINKSLYLLDLPGYGFAKASSDDRQRLRELINWYLFAAGYNQKLIILIIDAEVGPTAADLDFLQSLDKYRKNIVIVANKIDKIKKSAYAKQMEKIMNQVGNHKVIPYSAKMKIGVSILANDIFNACL